MQLDIPTLTVMGSFVWACAAAVLSLAWWQHRKILALALWAFSDIAAAGGILCLILGSPLHPAWFIPGGILLALSPALMWRAARTLDMKPAPDVLMLLGVAVVVFANGVPGLRDVAASLSLASGVVYSLAAAASLWVGRKERLAARWPLILLTVMHAAVLSLGVYDTLSGSLGLGIAPPVMSLFGLVHFEGIIFALGTAVFILALVKERTEAAVILAARTDGLTGIANRAAFIESAERVLERCRRENAPASVMMFDLDLFKAVNDTYGHAVGDDVIRKFCEVAAAALRPNEVFGRIGGEEFAIVLPNSGLEAAWVRAERIRASFAENCRIVGDNRVAGTVSGGVSANGNADDALSTLLYYADIALYRAKAEGRNRIQRADQHTRKGLSSVLRVA